jgi:hypothetical protein
LEQVYLVVLGSLCFVGRWILISQHISISQSNLCHPEVLQHENTKLQHDIGKVLQIVKGFDLRERASRAHAALQARGSVLSSQRGLLASLA